MKAPLPTRVPLDIGPIHFIGIGGIGMSGIAEIMHNLGYKVCGSDAADGANVKRLRALGIPIVIGHSADNVGNVYAVVYSSAVKPGNIEFEAARQRGLPLVRRAEMLAEIMRLKWCVAVAGTNGKTTTTTMVAALLDAGGLDPPWSTAGLSTPTAPTRGSAPATGWWWKPTKATDRSCGCPPPSPC
jgi:UDP-N-acetylmuramate--alanine ligase